MSTYLLISLDDELRLHAMILNEREARSNRRFKVDGRILTKFSVIL